MNDTLKKILQVGLLVIIVVVTYLIVSGIKEPIDFNKEKDKRCKVVISRLKDIREIQVIYKSKYNKYCNNIDSLAIFVKTDSVEVIKKIGDIEDSVAVAEGRARWDTLNYPVLDRILEEGKVSKDINYDSLAYIPFSGGQKFFCKAGKVMTGSKVSVEVFEVHAENKQILVGLNNQLRINLDDSDVKRSGFAGLKVGDLKEANNNAGNWEK